MAAIFFRLQGRYNTSQFEIQIHCYCQNNQLRQLCEPWQQRNCANTTGFYPQERLKRVTHTDLIFMIMLDWREPMQLMTKYTETTNLLSAVILNCVEEKTGITTCGIWCHGGVDGCRAAVFNIVITMQVLQGTTKIIICYF